MMKIISVLYLTCFVVLFGQSQINGVTVSPSNPQIGDTITVYVDLTFSSGDCDLDTATVQVTDSTVYVSVFHCPGALAVICDITDTVEFVLDSAWNYELLVGVYVGGGFMPCSYPPGPNDTDQSFIEVADSSGMLGVHGGASGSFIVYPNPTTGAIQLSTEAPYESVEVFSLTGKLIATYPFQQNLDLHLPAGMYLIRLTEEKSHTRLQRLILTK